MEALHLYYSIKGCQHHRVMNTCMGFRGYSTYLRNDLCELENNVSNDRRNEFDNIINSK